MTSLPPTPPTGRRPSDFTTVKPSRPTEDLSKDPLLLLLPRDGHGRPVAGRIPLVCRIGEGGMGAAYYADHPRLNVEVAVKILPPHLVDQEPRLADRFVAEARMTTPTKCCWVAGFRGRRDSVLRGRVASRWSTR